MKKLFIFLIYLSITNTICIEAGRTLVIKSTIPDTKENGVEVDVVQVDPTKKNMFGKLIQIFGTELSGHGENDITYSNITNDSFTIKIFLKILINGLMSSSKEFYYNVPAGRDGDTICIEVNETGIKECMWPVAKR
jgi:hypothetical protein